MSINTEVFKLKNKNNVEVTFIANGGKLTSIKVPDKKGIVADVVIGYEGLEATLAGDTYFGALCGRYANRIANGQFSIDGVSYQLECNNNKNHLHGGFDGFNKRIWDIKPISMAKYTQAYKLTLVSEDGDQSYPGKLEVNVVYGLTEANEFVIEYKAETTKPTIINLTSHAYFNLKGAGTDTIENHKLQINAAYLTPISGSTGNVTGEISAVAGTAMDFTKTKKIGLILAADDAQVKLADGMDHNFVIDGFDGSIKLAAILEDPDSGRKMEVYTNQPGIQIYTGNHFDGSETGKLGTPIEKWAGLALETQIFPDSPNKENFPGAVLRSGELYKHTCIYKFI